ncbi:MAG: hypothetical protein SGJ10_07955 [Bacteroidota bacterium]|nr:hypothetical protein [Bacteroidota bacterium]
MIPIHWGKFALGHHNWDDSIIRVSAAAKENNMPLITPMIGEEVDLKEMKYYSNWWEGVR